MNNMLETKLTKRNVLDFLTIVNLVLGVVYTCRLLLPARAELTIFIDNVQFKYVIGNNDSNAFDLIVNVTVVNDSPVTARVREWELSLNFNITYDVLRQTSSHSGLLLSSDSQTEFRFVHTLIGENNTRLPQTALRSVVVMVQYEDHLGIQRTKREYSFV